MAKIIIMNIRKDFFRNISFKTNMILILREICLHKNCFPELQVQNKQGGKNIDRKNIQPY